MKNTIFLLAIIFISIAVHLEAQIKVSSGGQVKVLGDREQDDPFHDLSMQVFGPYGEYLANGRIGIGDYGRTAFNGSNVFIGELGTDWDSDRLQLHGKKGIYLTWGQGYPAGGIIAKWDDTEPNKFIFETDVYAKGVLLTSDKRLKENIRPLQKKLNAVTRLNGISYTLKTPENTENYEVAEAGSLTKKEQADLANLRDVQEKKKASKRTRLGFVAQDVQVVFPELVEENAEGYLSVDYLGLIPVLVEAIKEQQGQIEELQKNAIKDGFIPDDNQVNLNATKMMKRA